MTNDSTLSTLRQNIPLSDKDIDINILMRTILELNKECSDSNFSRVEISRCRIKGTISSSLLRDFMDSDTQTVTVQNEIYILDSAVHDAFIIPMICGAVKGKSPKIVFTSNLTFANVVFHDEFSIENTIFNNDVTFEKCTFEKSVVFFKSVFAGQVFLSQNIFNNIFQVSSTEFKFSVAFIDICFLTGAMFSGVQFLGKHIVFLHITIGEVNRIDLYDTCFCDDALITFSEIPYEQLRLRWKQLRRVKRKRSILKSILYTISYYAFYGLNSNFSSKYLDSKYHFKINYESNLYYSIIKKLTEQGRYRAADDAYYEFQKRRRLEDSSMTYGEKMIGWMSDVWSGYGFKPYRLLMLMFLILLGLTLIFSQPDALVYKDAPLVSNTLFEHIFSAFYFSAITFFTIGYGDITPANNIFFRFIAICGGFLGWICLTLLLVFLGRKFVR